MVIRQWELHIVLSKAITKNVFVCQLMVIRQWNSMSSYLRLYKDCVCLPDYGHKAMDLHKAITKIVFVCQLMVIMQWEFHIILFKAIQ